MFKDVPSFIQHVSIALFTGLSGTAERNNLVSLAEIQLYHEEVVTQVELTTVRHLTGASMATAAQVQTAPITDIFVNAAVKSSNHRCWSRAYSSMAGLQTGSSGRTLSVGRPIMAPMALVESVQGFASRTG